VGQLRPHHSSRDSLPVLQQQWGAEPPQRAVAPRSPARRTDRLPEEGRKAPAAPFPEGLKAWGDQRLIFLPVQICTSLRASPFFKPSPPQILFWTSPFACQASLCLSVLPGKQGQMMHWGSPRLPPLPETFLGALGEDELQAQAPALPPPSLALPDPSRQGPAQVGSTVLVFSFFFSIYFSELAVAGSSTLAFRTGRHMEPRVLGGKARPLPGPLRWCFPVPGRRWCTCSLWVAHPCVTARPTQGSPVTLF